MENLNAENSLKKIQSNSLNQFTAEHISSSLSSDYISAFQNPVHNKYNSISSSINSLDKHSNQSKLNRSTHQRTRSVDLRFTSNSVNSLLPSLPSHNQPEPFLLTIEEKVSKLYYKHGLFCSRHPWFIIALSLVVVIISSHQIFTFHGIVGSSYEVYTSSSSLKSSILSKENDLSHSLKKHLNFWSNSFTRTELDINADQNIPPWFQQNQSFAYVQQIYIRSAVIPWTGDMQLVDALRGPFELIFELIEAISNFHLENDLNEEITLNDVCFQVFEPTLSKHYAHIASHLPSYSCLLLSPSNIWHGDSIKFQQDTNLLTTLLKFQDISTSPLPSGALHDILYGVTFEDTGIRRTYGKNRVRTITYSITLVLRKNVPNFIESLKEFLEKRYPISALINKEYKTNLNHNESTDHEQIDETLEDRTRHIYFYNTFTYNYLIPLFMLYAIVCLSMYFSVRKIELIRNKRLYSFCTLTTVLLSLVMSFGICFRFRFHSVLIVNWLLPYFVACISLENMLVLTKSVVANPHLDSKVRVAQALSREGILITKNLLAELALLSIGSFILVPFFQEYCKIAAICFLSDFFIQITYFTSFFSLLTQRIKERNGINSNNFSLSSQSYRRNVFASMGEQRIQSKTPKRLRFLYFLAKLRLVQRGFILILSAFIGRAIYMMLEPQNPVGSQFEPPIINSLNQTSSSNISLSNKLASDQELTTIISPTIDKAKLRNDPPFSNKEKNFIKLIETKIKNVDNLSTRITPSLNPYYRIFYTKDNPLPKPFVNHHWTNLFSLYNISLVSRFISILPPISLSIPITPERAKQVRNVADSDYHTLKKFIPLKFTNGEYVVSDDDYDKFEQLQHIHWFWENVHLIIGLWTPSFILFVYLLIQLYRCICSRNYAEWRTSLFSSNPLSRLRTFIIESTMTSESNSEGKLVRMDILMLNHDREKQGKLSQLNSDIDLISTNINTSLVAASSLSGDIRVYDALTCDSLAIIKRSRAKSDFSFYKRANIPGFHDNYENIENDDTSPIIIKSDGKFLETLFYGVNNHAMDNSQTEINENNFDLDFQPIWCMDIYDKYILVGCGGEKGRLEAWNSHTGLLEFVYNEQMFSDKPGAITAIKATYWGVALARINGQLEMLELNQINEDKYTILQESSFSSVECSHLKYQPKYRIQCHKQPITRLEIIDSLEDEEFIKTFGSRGCLISGSMDTTLKVFALDNFKLMYTFNGHCGAIVTTTIDPFSTANALSGCQLGQLCVWDLTTGTCIFSMQAHSEAEIISITTSSLYYATTGTDNIICIWDRYSGHLVQNIDNQHTICRSMLFLESCILVTVRDSELVIWDVNDARSICMVTLAKNNHYGEEIVDNDGDDDEQIEKWTKSYRNSLIKNLVFSYHRKALICDYGNNIYIINNPFITKKMD